MTEKKEKEITWRAAEYEYVKKDAAWYWMVITLVVVLALIAMWQKNFFFFVFLVLSGIVVLFFGRRRPRILTFRVGDEGVGIGRRIFHRYDRLDGFCLRDRPHGLDEIILKKKTLVSPYVRVPLDAALARKVEKVLGDNLSKIEYEESLMDVFAEWLGF